MTEYFDEFETQSADERAARQLDLLKVQIERARQAPYFDQTLAGFTADDLSDLAKLPVVRKSDLIDMQGKEPPFGGMLAVPVKDLARVYMSPGPILDPDGYAPAHDWWRFGRAAWAAGLRNGDIVANCFSYHLTPAGRMFEEACHACGATVLPAGIGNTEAVVQAMSLYKATAYAGTPDYPKALLDKAADLKLDLSSLKTLMVGAGPLFPSMRQDYHDRGMTCLQTYGTADLGNVAYESKAMEGLITDEDVIVEIVRPGTGDPVDLGEVGEVVVTLLTNRDYPLIRFATGDLSAILPGVSPCGRTAPRIKGWMGRADQTAKIRGMFVRPNQVAEIVARFAEITKARIVISSDDAKKDVMTVHCEATGDIDAAKIAETVQSVTKLKGAVVLAEPGSLPNDGKVIDDTRDFSS
ncbi:phenylacetate--CoA ligase [Rhodospirillaceae bacterium KN72]|uniref:Phenylacetate--CoA ligase n=1 Tax=Pacificispira spongiicola TaxID=2729598 RepID=A0A7Y0E217_9PROT|nr:AMP-binding protein [Pacificispira spongiicola]NMM45814.1 phenylacetate--CoA ligase [Pacificispira spongiicola]